MLLVKDYCPREKWTQPFCLVSLTWQVLKKMTHLHTETSSRIKEIVDLKLVYFFMFHGLGDLQRLSRSFLSIVHNSINKCDFCGIKGAMTQYLLTYMQVFAS